MSEQLNHMIYYVTTTYFSSFWQTFAEGEVAVEGKQDKGLGTLAPVQSNLEEERDILRYKP